MEGVHVDLFNSMGIGCEMRVIDFEQSVGTGRNTADDFSGLVLDLASIVFERY